MTDKIPFGLGIEDDGGIVMLVGEWVYPMTVEQARRMADYFDEAADIADIRRTARSN